MGVCVHSSATATCRTSNLPQRTAQTAKQGRNALHGGRDERCRTLCSRSLCQLNLNVALREMVHVFRRTVDDPNGAFVGYTTGRGE